MKQPPPAKQKQVVKIANWGKGKQDEGLLKCYGAASTCEIKASRLFGFHELAKY